MAVTGNAPIPNRFGLPDLGLGLGLRGPHIAEVLATWPDVDWWEVIADNHIVNQGWLLHVLDRLAERYPVVLHGVGLDIGTTDPLDRDYLRQLKALADRVKAPWVSDHLCWTGVDGLRSYDLLPVPYTDEALAWIAARIRVVQDVLERPLVLENPSSYLTFRESTWTEWDFMRALVETADCALLLDVNNVYVAAANHAFDTASWLAAVPWDRVAQVHVAGPSQRDGYLFDSHTGPVPEAVWALHAEVMRRTGGRATLLEWDADVPTFAALRQEAERGRHRPVSRQPDAPTHPATRNPPIAEPGPPPPRLQATYRWLQTQVLQGVTPDTHPPHLRRQGSLTTRQRLHIHRDMYLARTGDALREDFPAVAAAVPAAFAALVNGYRTACPPRAWALELYGGQFPAFLKAALPRLAPGAPPWLADLAALEWAHVEAWLAPEVPLLDPGALAAVAPEDLERLRLHLAPSVRLLHLAHAIGAKGAVRLPAGPVLVSRLRYEVRERAMDPVEAALLQALRELALGPAFEAVVEAQPAAAEALAAGLGAWCQAWAQGGVVTAVS